MPAVKKQQRSLVDHLNEQAAPKIVNDIVSLDRYLLSAQYLLNQARDYRARNNLEQLYVILMRYASLVIETIPQHRDFKLGGAPTKYVSLKKDLAEKYLPELEHLKLELRLRDRPEPPPSTIASSNRPSDAVLLSTSNLPQLDWASAGAPPLPASPAPPQPLVDDLLDILNGRGNGDGSSAVGAVAHMASTSYGSYGAMAGNPVGYVQGLPGAGSSGTYGYGYGSSPAAALPPGVEMPQLKYSISYAGASASSGDRHALFGNRSAGSGGAGMGSGTLRTAGGMPRYPSLEQAPGGAIAPQMGQLSIGGPLDSLPMGHPSAGPALGPQETQVAVIAPGDYASLPHTCAQHQQQQPPPPPPLEPPTAALAAPVGGPKELEKRAQMRDVHVSVALMEEFLHYARSNTGRGIESCGILAGKLLADDSVFAITTLIIPKQQGTSDTVQALNEEEIFEAQFERELYPLGWIHTHPTQTCFLSSVDVHTQCGYQTMLDEAVAIVMAPRDSGKRCGIFRLSTPGGLGLVQKCPLRGFHTHPPTSTGQELYELCGHVYLNERTKHSVIDLR